MSDNGFIIALAAIVGLLLLGHVLSLLSGAFKHILSPILASLWKTIGTWTIFSIKQLVNMHKILFTNMVKSNEEIYPTLERKE